MKGNLLAIKAILGKKNWHCLNDLYTVHSTTLRKTIGNTISCVIEPNPFIDFSSFSIYLGIHSPILDLGIQQWTTTTTTTIMSTFLELIYQEKKNSFISK